MNLTLEEKQRIKSQIKSQVDDIANSNEPYSEENYKTLKQFNKKLEKDLFELYEEMGLGGSCNGKDSFYTHLTQKCNSILEKIQKAIQE